MSNFKLNLPTDIPWKRKCVSQDMIDKTICDRKFPYRWRSSIAIFEYQPEEENQTYEGMTITYLKVSCTITGYQADAQEIGLKSKGVRDFWKDQPGIDDYLNALKKYYACYGAILEVAVSPEGGNVLLANYPYFLDFDPKKRELYELVSDTGETMSRSLNNVEIGKSNSTLNSNEVVDIDKGYSVAAKVSVGEIGVGGSFSRQGEWGTRSVTQDQAQSMKNTDTSQESRETQSHTTQLSQMYHQLDSYHLGTNRAVFFIHPRPHTIETEHTFVNGPRNIEGIQDFMFVVARPKEVEDICVEAYLETGHLAKIFDWQPQEVPGTEMKTLWNEAYSAKPKGDDDETPNVDDKDRVWAVADHYPGYKIKGAVIIAMHADIRYNYDKPNLVDMWPFIADQNADFVRVSGKVHSGFANHAAGSDRWEEINLPFTVEITIAKEETVQTSKDTLFITGRGLCCCPQRLNPDLKESVVFEKAMTKKVSSEEKLTIRQANSIQDHIRSEMIDSATDMDHRYPSGIVQLQHSVFAAETLNNLARAANHDKISEHQSIDPNIKDKINSFSRDLTISQVIQMPFQMQKDLFDLKDEEVITLRNALAGFNHTVTDKKSPWLTRAQYARYLKQTSIKGPETRGRK